MSPLTVILSFLKLGIISFGGGAALLPVIGDELVEKRKWLDKDRFNYSVAVIAAAPGSQPVALCSIWNSKFSLLSAYAYALPGPVLFLILSTGFALIGESGVRYIGFASLGIICFILLVICAFIKKCYLYGTKSVPKLRYLLLIAAAFILTCGAALRNLLINLFALNSELIPGPVFALNMIDLLIMAFFIVFFIGKSSSYLKIAPALLLAGLYALASGRMGLLADWTWLIAACMAALALGSLLYDTIYRRDENKSYKFDMTPLKSLPHFLLIPLAIAILAYFMSGDLRTWDFSFRILASALTSFGGGEAYIAVADAIFVQSGFISAEVYYSRIIGISSAMPGPVLMSIAAGIGFAFGSSTGGIFIGWLFGILAISLAITATAVGALFLLTCFETFKDSQRLEMIIKYIMPLVCGMLISIALSLINQSSGVMIREGIGSWPSIGIVLAVFLLMQILRIKYHFNDIKLLLLGGMGTLAALSLFAFFAT